MYGALPIAVGRKNHLPECSKRRVQARQPSYFAPRQLRNVTTNALTLCSVGPLRLSKVCQDGGNNWRAVLGSRCFGNNNCTRNHSLHTSLGQPEQRRIIAVSWVDAPGVARGHKQTNSPKCSGVIRTSYQKRPVSRLFR